MIDLAGPKTFVKKKLSGILEHTESEPIQHEAIRFPQRPTSAGPGALDTERTTYGTGVRYQERSWNFYDGN